MTQGQGWATPALSRHARARRAEMGISTKIAKRIVQDPCTTRPAGGCTLYVSNAHPLYAVVVDTSTTPATIVTVVFRTTEQYARQGATYTTKETVR